MEYNFKRNIDMHNTSKKLFILDTNILMHDPNAIFRFHEHDIFIPMVVLEELDKHKTGISEVARNVRQTNRTLDELVSQYLPHDIIHGIPLHQEAVDASGKLYLQTDLLDDEPPGILPGQKADNHILGIALSLKKKLKDKEIIIVSKDINLRIKATILGILAEDYYNDKVLDDVSLLHSGLHMLANDFWEANNENVEAWQVQNQIYYKISGLNTDNWCPNDCLLSEDESFKAIIKEIKNEDVIIKLAKDYTIEKNAVWGIQAKNNEQNFALNLLLDPEIDFITLQGPAGTGKTLLTIAAGLTQVFDYNLYNEIIMTRVTIPVGEDIGFLPGTEEEKMTPWMGALMDNLEVLHSRQDGGAFGRMATEDLLKNKIKIRSLNFMRGRTFLKRFIIIDEAQNLTSKQIKTLITRAGPGSKIVCLGDIKQIDTPYLTETNSGLTFAVHRMRQWEHSAHITLSRGERSRLAQYAAQQM
jgi:PhoH-like ATPase